MLLGTVAFGGLGLLLAGVLRAEVNLAAVNGLYLVLLLLGGMLVPLAKLPGASARSPGACPAAALSDGLHATLGHRRSGPGRIVGRRSRIWAVADAGRGVAHLPLGVSALDGARAPRRAAGPR